MSCPHVHYSQGGPYSQLLTIVQDEHNDEHYTIKHCSLCHGIVLEIKSPYINEQKHITAWITDSRVVDILINETSEEKMKREDTYGMSVLP